MEFVKEENLAEGVQGIEVEDEAKFEDWSEEEGDEEAFAALFSDETFPTIQALLNHTKTVHDFDLIKIATDVCKDEIDFIRLVNFVRKSVSEENLKPEEAKSRIYEQKYVNDDVYMMPVLADDALLFRFEDVITFSEDADENEGKERVLEGVSEEDRIARLLETQADRNET
eukprot:gene36723-44547_t